MLAVPDFPSPGVVFQDVTPVLADAAAFRLLVDWLARCAGPVEAVAGIEARGFVLGAPVAYALDVPFIPVRKAGKLPRAVHDVAYDLEYGTATLAMHADAPIGGRKVLVVDDVLATGGTADAACRLVERCKGDVTGVAVLLEISALGGRARLPGRPLHALLAV
ncbi:MAG TPA: adenine phosphoribosyltransferase [Mycobacteriales bacterium]